MKFYELGELIRGCIDEETGEVDIDRFNELTEEKNKKIENLALYTFELKASIDALKNETARLTARRNALENKLDGIRNFLANYLNGEKFKTDMVTVSAPREFPRVVIDDQTLIPKKYIQKVTTEKVNSGLIMEAFAANKTVKGCHIDTKKSVTIR